MALLHESADNKKFDVRMIERNQLRGVISQKETEDFLKSLSDDTEAAEWVSVDAIEKGEVPPRQFPPREGSSSSSA